MCFENDKEMDKKSQIKSQEKNHENHNDHHKSQTNHKNVVFVTDMPLKKVTIQKSWKTPWLILHRTYQFYIRLLDENIKSYCHETIVRVKMKKSIALNDMERHFDR